MNSNDSMHLIKSRNLTYKWYLHLLSKRKCSSRVCPHTPNNRESFTGFKEVFLNDHVLYKQQRQQQRKTWLEMLDKYILNLNEALLSKLRINKKHKWREIILKNATNYEFSKQFLISVVFFNQASRQLLLFERIALLWSSRNIFMKLYPLIFHWH